MRVFQVPETIPYKVGVMGDQPGWFKLYYVPNRTVHHEIITLRPAGYRMRSRTFATLKNKAKDYGEVVFNKIL